MEESENNFAFLLTLLGLKQPAAATLNTRKEPIV